MCIFYPVVLASKDLLLSEFLPSSDAKCCLSVIKCLLVFHFTAQQAYNVETTSIQQQNVESTLFQRCLPSGMSCTFMVCCDDWAHLDLFENIMTLGYVLGASRNIPV